MSKFSNTPSKTRTPTSVLGVTDTPTRTYNGASAVAYNDKTALFTLAVVNMVGESKFYETAGESDKRFVDLIHKVTKADPAWIRGFIPFLRDEMNMRSASIVMAAEYVRAGGPNGRAVVKSACSRADEPAEMLGYWTSTYGRNIPQPVKRGVADAAQELYNEYSVMKYDGSSRGWRVGDVVQVAHVKPKAPWQSDLFKYALDRRYQGADAVPPVSLTMVRNSQALAELVKTPRGRAKLLDQRNVEQTLKDAGWTWERLAGTGAMDAKAWEAIIPAMGYMALLRNLRNFDDAGISQSTVRYVREYLTDPDKVARSRQLPFRFLSAYKATRSDNWSTALAEALDLSVQNIPAVDGNTLTIIDTSGSMTAPLSERSSVQLMEAGALFGAAMARKNGGDVVVFGTGHKAVDIRKGDSILRSIEKITRTDVGWSTNLAPAISAHYNGHKRVVVFTDMQVNPGSASVDMLYYFNLGGYGRVPTGPKGDKQFYLGGFSDKVFSMMSLIERGKDANWPWEN